MIAPRWIWAAAFLVSGLLHISGLMLFSINSRPSSAAVKQAVVLQSGKLFKLKAVAIKPKTVIRQAKPPAKTVRPTKVASHKRHQAVKPVKRLTQERQPVLSPYTARAPALKRPAAPSRSRPVATVRARPEKSIEPARQAKEISPVVTKKPPRPTRKTLTGQRRKVVSPKAPLAVRTKGAVISTFNPTSLQSQQKTLATVKPISPRHIVKATPARRPRQATPVSRARVRPVKRQKLAALPRANRPVTKLVPRSLKQHLIPQSEKLARYISSYKGGSCFYALPLKLAGPVPQIIGFGTSVPAFLQFTGAIEKQHKVTAQIGMRLVSRAQCPLVDFAQATLGNTAPQLDIFFQATNIRSGHRLHGLVAKTRDPHLAILLVDDQGRVHNIAGYSRATAQGIAFDPPVSGTDDGRSRVQIIVALASRQALPALQGNNVRWAKDVFPLLIRQIESAPSPVKVGLRAFVVR